MESLKVAGIRLGTTCAGIKYPNRRDLVVIEAAAGTRAAAVFTRNAFCAAPVIVARTHLAAASHLANYKSGIVVIHATSGAVATKLKQLAPTLADGFSRKGVECNGVQVKVQARESGTQSRTSEPKPLSSSASRSLSDLRDNLPESPLRAALQTLIERAPRT